MEIKDYLDILDKGEFDAEIDPFSFWKEKSGRFSNLSGIALQYLAMPATSASAERLFSCGIQRDSKSKSMISEWSPQIPVRSLSCPLRTFNRSMNESPHFIPKSTKNLSKILGQSAGESSQFLLSAVRGPRPHFILAQRKRLRSSHKPQGAAVYRVRVPCTVYWYIVENHRGMACSAPKGEEPYQRFPRSTPSRRLLLDGRQQALAWMSSLVRTKDSRMEYELTQCQRMQDENTGDCGLSADLVIPTENAEDLPRYDGNYYKRKCPKTPEVIIAADEVETGASNDENFVTDSNGEMADSNHQQPPKQQRPRTRQVNKNRGFKTVVDFVDAINYYDRKLGPLPPSEPSAASSTPTENSMRTVNTTAPSSSSKKIKISALYGIVLDVEPATNGTREELLKAEMQNFLAIP
ncbi:hypothetical protein OUZ56_018409 [Daphnia magna]|uniref:HAT C-terminal dimerisation domain-containing protein n=1 Tax=Daphnia magna TaxID=35525 RepID=A0ABQ9Z8T2_9CRUS|nr:hypothetical protein OUZ56_018409 [Daphnia magna]